ncbi:monovalent cation/H(+) antiporter subunit G [Testudinibacter aquarius]|uniref:Monovalent cation/H(+) antiporter subunit G n=2 Tax=Testudinibacter aquarius TaxID=1524974 RepID=A0ABY2XRX1_9PAST|nr:monovalent cation/H(+) antiporter subunit G [Testudinibacter aquarius]
MTHNCKRANNMNTILEILGIILLLLGGLSLVVSALGIRILPNTLSKQHAATKAGTLAITLISLAAILLAQEWAWTLRLVIMSFFLILTLPLASHMLARAAVKDTRLLSEKDHPSVTPYQENPHK